MDRQKILFALIRNSGVISLTSKTFISVKRLAENLLGAFTKASDEHQLIGRHIFDFFAGVIEQNRAGLRRDEFIGSDKNIFKEFVKANFKIKLLRPPFA